MKNKKMKQALMACTVIFASLSVYATPIELITNGDFETGDLTAWTTTDIAGGSGSWYTSVPGASTPESSISTSASGGLAHGEFYAVSDQPAPGTHALEQSFSVASGLSSVIFSFDMFVNNYGGSTVIGPLDHRGDSVEYGRVDIMFAGASAFDIGSGVLSNLFTSGDIGTLPNPFLTYSFDITSLVRSGGDFKIRFAESDNQGNFNMGIDNVSILASSVVSDVPEPSILALFGLSFLTLGMRRRKKS